MTKESGAGACFVTTHWSLIVRAGQASLRETNDALEQLCSVYWRPLYAFARHHGHSPEDAEDLTQAFFLKLFEKSYISDAQQDKGRFRTFLIIAFKRFLANEWDRNHALKRGGFKTVISMDAESLEAQFGSASRTCSSPDLIFERQWVLSLIDQVMSLLEKEYSDSGRIEVFRCLKPCVSREADAPAYLKIAMQLQISEAAVKMAVQRLRARYKQLLRAEILKTVSDENEVDEEIRHLFATFSAA